MPLLIPSNPICLRQEMRANTTPKTATKATAERERLTRLTAPEALLEAEAEAEAERAAEVVEDPALVTEDGRVLVMALVDRDADDVPEADSADDAVDDVEALLSLAEEPPPKAAAALA